MLFAVGCHAAGSGSQYGFDGVDTGLGCAVVAACAARAAVQVGSSNGLQMCHAHVAKQPAQKCQSAAH